MTALTQGSVALFARDARWRRAVGRKLSEDGHAFEEAASPGQVGEILHDRRFDVLALSVKDEDESQQIDNALGKTPLPLHTIVVGNASGLELNPHRKRGGTFRYVPGSVSPEEIARLIDLTLSAGGWEEAAGENGSSPPVFQEVDLQEQLEHAAATVYSAAKRKRLRFNTVYDAGHTHALADPRKLAGALETLMRLSVALTPRNGTVSVEADGGSEDRIVQFRLSQAPRASRPAPAGLAASLQEETSALAAVSKAMKDQGGMLWVELGGSASLTLSIALPPAGDDAHPRSNNEHGRREGVIARGN